MRVHELAKKLGYENKAFIEKIKSIGINDKTHLSGLTDDQINVITSKLSNVNNVTKEKAISKESNQVNIEQTKKDTIVKEKIVFSNRNNQNNIVKTTENVDRKVEVNPVEAKKETEEKVANDSNNRSDNDLNNRNSYNRNNQDNRNNFNRDNNRNNFNRDNRDSNNNFNRNNDSGNRNNFNRDNRDNNNNFNRNNDSGNRNNFNRDNRDNNNNFNRNNESGNRNNFNRDNRDNNNNFNRNNESGNRNNFNRDNRDNNNNFNRNNDSGNRNNFNRDNRDNNNNNFNRNNESGNRNNFNRDNRDNNNNNNNRNNNFNRNNDSGNRNNFNRDNRDNRNFKDNRKPAVAKPEESVIAPATDKPKVMPKNKVKFDKKKYEQDKKQREEEKKLRELRSDFRREDKKKTPKKKEKVMKNEIVMLEGDTIGSITIRDEISLKELAEKLGINVSDIIKKFFMEGKIITANAILTFEEAEEIALEREVLVEREIVDELSYGDKYNLEIEDREEDLIERAPVITIMGHVDHGKTSLLDAIRKTNVIEGEAGGITQKIGAYQIKWKDHKITFIDTPGHEAFTEMRARGAKVTDIAILIVAADDGVKPQTIEAIAHAKEANVPIIVAVNKIDKPGADVMRVKQELLEYGLMAPDWGGDTEFVEISAKQRINLESLLETIILTSELLELKANPKKRPKAVVIESRLDPKMGAVADILIQEGELEIGDIFVAGESYGRVRSMLDDRGNKITKAKLAKPVEITGFNNIPEAGDVLYGVQNDKQAKKIVEDFIKERKINEQNKKKHISLESLSQELEDQQLKELKCIIRGDSKGSVEALKESLSKLNNEKSMVNIIQATAGAITEGDVKLAEASDAIIIGFNVRPTTPARAESEKLGVEIRTYNVIYHIIEDIEKAMKGMLDPEYKEVYLGRIEVKQVFKISNVGNIAGAIVVDGKVNRESKIRVLRDGIIIHDGELETLKRYKDEAKEVVHGQECGIKMRDFNDIKEGDIIESYILEELPR